MLGIGAAQSATTGMLQGLSERDHHPSHIPVDEPVVMIEPLGEHRGDQLVRRRVRPYDGGRPSERARRVEDLSRPEREPQAAVRVPEARDRDTARTQTELVQERPRRLGWTVLATGSSGWARSGAACPQCQNATVPSGRSVDEVGDERALTGRGLERDRRHRTEHVGLARRRRARLGEHALRGAGCRIHLGEALRPAARRHRGPAALLDEPSQRDVQPQRRIDTGPVDGVRPLGWRRSHAVGRAQPLPSRRVRPSNIASSSTWSSVVPSVARSSAPAAHGSKPSG
jgi:hypothetical protein